MEIPKAYEPKEVEKKIYNLWEKGKFFMPKKVNFLCPKAKASPLL